MQIEDALDTLISLQREYTGKVLRKFQILDGFICAAIAPYPTFFDVVDSSGESCRGRVSTS